MGVAVLEMRSPMIQEFLVETAFAAGLGLFEPVQEIFVDGEAGLFAVRAGVIAVFDTGQETEIGGLEFREGVEGFDLSDESVFLRQDRPLAGQIGFVPGHDIGEQTGYLVVHVVACDKHGEVAFNGHFIEIMAFELAADRADGPFDRLPDRRNGKTFGGELDDLQGDIEPVAEAFGNGPGRKGRFPDAEIEMQAGDIIPEFLELPGNGQGVLAPADGHEESVVPGKHFLGMNGPLHLPGKENQITFLAKGRVMTGQGHDRRLFAAFAFHESTSGDDITDNDGVVTTDLAVRGEQLSVPDDQDVAGFAIDAVQKLEHRIDFRKRMTRVIRFYGHFHHIFGYLRGTGFR